MKFNISLFFVLSLLSISCDIKTDANQIKIPIENILFNRFKKGSIQSGNGTFFKSRKFVKLEIGQHGNYFGLISKISLINNNFYVLDSRKKILVIYSSVGKYLGNIYNVKRDYQNMDDFDVDDRGEIYAIDGKLDKLLIYGSNLKLLKQQKLPFEVDVLQILNHNGLLLGLSSWNKQSNMGDQLLHTDKNLNVLETLLKYGDYIDNNFWLGDYRFLKADGYIFYNKPIDNNVYTFSENGKMEKIYHFDFGDMNVPDLDKKNIQANLSKFKKYRSLTNFTVINKTFAFGSILDKQDERFFYLDRINNEIFLEDLNTQTQIGHIINYSNKHVYTYIIPGEYERLKFKDFPQDVQDHLSKGGYILCDYELK